MHHAKWTALAVLAALALAAPAHAVPSSTVDSGGAIQYASEKAAQDPASGIPSFTFSPGTTTTFTVQAGDGNVDTFTATSKAHAKSFDSLWFDAEWAWKRVQYGDYKWTWAHYFQWAGLNSCVTSIPANDQWSKGEGAFWHYRGAGSYVVKTINACVGWAGRQGHYNYCPVSLCFDDDWPWETSRLLGWGDWSVYASGR